MFFPFRSSTCGGSCKNINKPCAKKCVPDVVRNLNVKVFNLVSKTNETRRIEWLEWCKCKRGFNSSVCNNKQRWNGDKYRCECKEVIDKSVYDKGLIWNPSYCECKCSKSCDFSEYFDYENCKSKKMLVDKLAEEYTENNHETRLVEINSTACKHNSCTRYIALLSIIFTVKLELVAIFYVFTGT